MRFEVRPAGKGAPRIDPKPILDGWKLLESTAVYRAPDTGPLAKAASTEDPTVGQLLLMSKEELQKRVLDDDRASRSTPAAARDIEAGGIDRRVLATLVFLTANGLQPTVSSLHCGHGYMTASGNVSEHSSGSAVDIAAINGTPIVGHQGEGTITDTTIRKLLTLQGTMKPHQIISLMTYPNATTRSRWPTTTTTSTWASRRSTTRTQERQGAQLGPQAGPVVQADRAPRQHRQPDRLGEALQVLARRPLTLCWRRGALGDVRLLRHAHRLERRDRRQLERLLGGSRDELLSRYHEVEPRVQSARPAASYREVMAAVLAELAAERGRRPAGVRARRPRALAAGVAGLRGRARRGWRSASAAAGGSRR